MYICVWVCVCVCVCTLMLHVNKTIDSFFSPSLTDIFMLRYTHVLVYPSVRSVLADKTAMQQFSFRPGLQELRL